MTSMRRVVRILAGVAAVGCALTSQALVSEAPKRVIYVNLSPDSARASEDLGALVRYDLLGINHATHTAQLHVSALEVSEIVARGFQIKFADAASALEGTQGKSLEGYHSSTEVQESLEATARAYPALTKLIEIGKTSRGRPIPAIIISAQPEDTSKPVVLFNSMHHARELMTTEVTLHIIKVLTEGFGQDSEVSTWLNSMRIVVVPQVNPDGNDLVHQGNNMWRKNAWEDNGRLTGVDLNRNYPAFWNSCNGSSGTKSSATYRGPTPASEPETQALINLVRSMRPVMDISYHSYSELIIFPFGCRTNKNPSYDLFKSIGNAMNAELINDDGRKNAYKVGTAPEVIYQADGTDLDWQWQEEGVLAYTLEVNSDRLGFQPDFTKWRDLTVTRQEGAWKQMLRRVGASGVRGQLHSSLPLEELSYTVEAIGTAGEQTPFTGEASSVKAFKARNAQGLVYQILQPGTYDFTFRRQSEPVKTLRVVVGSDLVDLGEISVP